MESHTPLVNSSNIQEYSGKIVRIPGMIRSVQMDQAMMETCDQGQVLIHLGSSEEGSQCEEGNAIVLGHANDDGSVNEIFTQMMKGNYGILE
jgi:hypothetical protein